MTRYLIVGGAGFIGSHVATRLLGDPDEDVHVRVFDNLVSGSRERVAHLASDARLELVVGDIKDLDALLVAAADVDHAFHFAANPDIAERSSAPTSTSGRGPTSRTTSSRRSAARACRA